jgi:transcription elongation factor
MANISTNQKFIDLAKFNIYVTEKSGRAIKYNDAISDKKA